MDAPKMFQISIPVDKIREVIGQGGKVIQKITAECEVKIDINEDGICICQRYEAGKLPDRHCRLSIPLHTTQKSEQSIRVRSFLSRPFGAFVEIAPGKDGLVHISKLDNSRVENVEDVVSMGDEIVVKVMEVKDGKISLSRKDALAELQAREVSKGSLFETDTAVETNAFNRRFCKDLLVQNGLQTAFFVV